MIHTKFYPTLSVFYLPLIFTNVSKSFEGQCQRQFYLFIFNQSMVL